MIVSFELTMPNVGSWNGKWTGESKKYFDIRTLSKDVIESITKETYYHFNFGDGWCACVKVEIIDSKEKRTRLKQSSGFCGYDWMVDSIIKNKKITTES